MYVRLPILVAFCGVLLSVGTKIVSAQDAGSAKTFLNSIFQHYSIHGKGIEYDARYLHSSLLSLIREDLKAANAASEVPDALDADIVCDCQEWDRFWVHKMDVKLVRPGRALAVVSFDVEVVGNRIDRDPRTMRYTLVPERGRWRIYDVEDLSGPNVPDRQTPLRNLILKDIEGFKHESK